MSKKTIGIQPFGNRMLVEQVKEAESGIILPDTVGMKALEFSYKGSVMAVGDEVKKVKVGDKVLFIRPMLPYLIIREEGKEYFLLQENLDILAILA